MNRVDKQLNTQSLPWHRLLPVQANELNSQEKALCDENIFHCIYALGDAQFASEASGEDFLWQDYGVNNEKDAFRHSFWNALMTIDINYLTTPQNAIMSSFSPFPDSLYE